MLQQIKKRNGNIVDFAPEKITLAAQKAFVAVKGDVEKSRLDRITEKVVILLEQKFQNQIPSVEDTQDIVEKVIMEEGFYDVAKAYVLYRHERTQAREKEAQILAKKLEKGDFYVIKRSGKKEKFSFIKLKNTLKWASVGFEKAVDVMELARFCRSELYEDISTNDIFKAATFASRSLLEKDPAYSIIASRLLRSILYRQVTGSKINSQDLRLKYRQAFLDNIKEGIRIGRLDKRLAKFDLEKLAKKLVVERDDLLLYLGLQTLFDRYFLSNPETKQILETPQAFWMRVAMGLALNEKRKTDAAVKFYEVMSTLRYVPSTPTLFHAGTIHPQMSSCYLTTVDDSLDHIFKCIGDNAQLSKWSGGLGNDWTNLRATGALIHGTGVESQGVIPFLKIANDTTVAINRSGRRRGATCAYLETWHLDIEDFLELRKNTGDERRRTHDMNTANWIPDLFLKRVREDGDWTLFSPDEVSDLHHLYGKKFEQRYTHYEKLAAEGKIKLFKKTKAQDLWKKMLTMLFETGHPWITFKDSCNIRSPQDHVGIVHSSNLCTEITLNTSDDETAVCNLGSVNLARHIKDGKLDENLIADTAAMAMRMLDNVIDLNYYPTQEARNSNLKHRPVGLGLMGLQDALYLLGLNFDSWEAVEFSDKAQEMISYWAILTSSKLAKERGKYQSFKGSKWDRGILPQDSMDLLEKERGVKIDVPKTTRLNWDLVRRSIKKYGMRNSNCLAIAPTATISNIAGCIPTIEPIYKNLYVKSNQSGDFTVINPYLIEDLKKLKLWSETIGKKIKYYDGSIKQIEEIPYNLKEKYKEVFEIDPRWLILAAAYRGRWIDQSQSLNIYFTGTSGKALDEIYQFAFEMGLKTTYYLRTLAASQVEKSTVDVSEFGATHLRPTNGQIRTNGEENRQGEKSGAAELHELHEACDASYACKIDDPDCEACQ